jgi:nicotinamidase-related amidase
MQLKVNYGGNMLNPMEAALLLVDFQSRLADIVDRKDLVGPNVVRLVQGCQALEMPILATVQVPEKLGPALPELVGALGEDALIPKTAFSAMREPEFLVAMQQSGRSQFILAGIEAHVCVLQTGLDLLDLGYKVHVLSDGVFSRTAENHDLALQRLHDAGATVSSVEMVLFDLIRTSTHPAFRVISKLVK